ncbi:MULTISPECIES: hypothetical protein [unclassified Microcoleus]|uniref:hypothetical protein n=1 Tax=unclassified Microcoleus TaxID=2642155 RepID=UPI001D89CB8A|nr:MULTISPECIES: hypothetical protein [unclassified Microcoleus]MCC3462651.1 hypothetical protein [Microcoleus sp. PH2017_11_PCY_U_A]TAF26716.1 MAG: hypothetical protein EAZ69_28585 [Oscillatoriales cyanobacterium]
MLTEIGGNDFGRRRPDDRPNLKEPHKLLHLNPTAVLAPESPPHKSLNQKKTAKISCLSA